MKGLYKEYLFQKHILVAEKKKAENTFETLFSLANLFGIRIIAGDRLADKSMIRYAASQLGERVPEPFYRGFPESVRALTAEELWYDQALHYFRTYEMGDFSEAGHSVFEDAMERAAFRESTQVRDFSILTEKEALVRLGEMVSDLLAGTRPLSDQAYLLCLTYIRDFGWEPEAIASKNTAIRLLLDLRDPALARHLMLSDVIKAVEELNHEAYKNDDIRHLNLKNKDRKFLAQVMDTIIGAGRCDIGTCFEKKQLWNGFLHHIHYRAKTEEGEAFVKAMRGNENRSAYAAFEAKMAEGDVRGAALVLKERKGAGAVLRNLNYLISRCADDDDVRFVADCLDTGNAILLIQLLLQYAAYRPEGEARTFAFSKFNEMRVHRETEEECDKRRSVISTDRVNYLTGLLQDRLKKLLKGRLGTVYIDPAMEKYGLPLNESTSQGGFGVLPKGSRLPIGEAKVVRAFTYWEKVDDIDLSVFGLDGEGRQTEFSWRTMAGRQSQALTFSGDQTSGYKGGSEYFDIDMALFRKKYPAIRYLVFCDNVFTGGVSFSDCFCRAGYMLRDKAGSGEVYEPKTVQSAFRVNCDSHFAYLFGIDLEKNEFVWLNIAKDSDASVAGTSRMGFLLDYFHVTEVINMASFFELLADKVTDRLEEADVIVTNHAINAPEGAEVIQEYDFEKVMALLNRRPN